MADNEEQKQTATGRLCLKLPLHPDFVEPSDLLSFLNIDLIAILNFWFEFNKN